MSKKYYSILTSAGKKSISNAMIIGEKVNIVSVAIGDGNGEYYEPNELMTKLKNEVWRGNVSTYSISEKDGSSIVVGGIIPANIGGFFIREIGVFDDKGTMIAVANTPDTEKASTESNIVNQMNISLELMTVNADTIKISVDENIVVATKKELESHVNNEEVHITENERLEWNDALSKTGDASNVWSEFIESTTRDNLSSGETLKLSLGKIAKWFSDLKSIAFSGAAADIVQDSTHRFTNDTDKSKLDGIEAGAQVNKITGVKGNAEVSYRDGNVNITPGNIGLGNVPNVATNDQTPTYTVASSNTNLSSGETMAVAFGKIAKAISSLISHLSNTSNPHSVTKAQVGLGNVDNTSDVSKPVSTATQTAINAAYSNSTGYTDTKIADLINGAPTTLDTLKEIADAMAADESVVQSLNDAIGTKANQTELDTHTGNSTIHITASERLQWNDALPKTGDASNVWNGFTASATRDNLSSGETLKLSLGKIAKWFSDLKSIAFSGVAADIVQDSTHRFTNDTDKSKLDGIEAGAQVNKITGVKGNAEVSYRDGNVNITPGNIGLGNVPNVATNDQTPTYTVASSNTNLSSGETIAVAFGKIAKAISSLIAHLSNTSNPHSVTKAQVGLGNVDNTSDVSKPVSTATQSAINAAYTNANGYTDTKIANLINGAPATLDTLKEIAEAMAADESVVQALNDAIGLKASQAELDTHTDNSTVHINASERSAWNAKQGAVVMDTDTSSNASPGYGGTFVVVDSVTKDANGHVTKVNLKTVTMPSQQTTISGNAATATKLATTRKINGVAFDGSADISHYATCSTAAATAAKTVSLTGFSLVAGAHVRVKMTYGNSVASPTLNVNSTGAKAIVMYGTTVPSMTAIWGDGDIVDFIYDGTNFVMCGVPFSRYEQLNADLSAANDNLAKKPTCELALSSLGLSLVIDSMPTSSVWKTVPVSSDFGYGADSIVIGISVAGFQTPTINETTYFEIGTVGDVLSIIPRNSAVYGASYAMILARVN